MKAAYTTALGQQLGVIRPEDTTDLSGTTERREYQAVYVSGDDEIGLRSDTVSGVFNE